MQISITTTQKFLSLFFAGSILLVISSCQKETNISLPAIPAVTKIRELKNNEEFIRFTYNEDGSVKKATVKSELNTANDIVDFNISYNAQKKIAEVIATNGEKIVPVYENNVMKRADVFDGTLRTRYTNYLYENDKLTRATVYLNQGNDFRLFLDFQFTYNATGDLSETMAMIASGVPDQLVRAGHVTYQYDQRVNPLFEHRDFLALLWQGVSKNNITREDHFDANLQKENVYTYTYTYKVNGLPGHAVLTTGLPGQPPVTTNLDFIYQ